jgi:hypothetical protein
MIGSFFLSAGCHNLCIHFGKEVAGMIIFTLRDLGEGFFPWNLNNKNDVVGHRDPSGESCVVFADGTVTVLPPEIASAQDISDDGIVLGTLAAAQPALVEIATSTVEPISIPGFPALQVNALSYKGDLVGSAGRANTSRMTGEASS